MAGGSVYRTGTGVNCIVIECGCVGIAVAGGGVGFIGIVVGTGDGSVRTVGVVGACVLGFVGTGVVGLDVVAVRVVGCAKLG